MGRIVQVASARMGPISRSDTCEDAVRRLIARQMIAESAFIASSGEIVAQAVSIEDEVIAARADLDLGNRYRGTIFNFAKRREPGAYTLIVERKGAVPPPES